MLVKNKKIFLVSKKINLEVSYYSPTRFLSVRAEVELLLCVWDDAWAAQESGNRRPTRRGTGGLGGAAVACPAGARPTFDCRLFIKKKVVHTKNKMYFYV